MHLPDWDTFNEPRTTSQSVSDRILDLLHDTRERIIMTTKLRLGTLSFAAEYVRRIWALLLVEIWPADHEMVLNRLWLRLHRCSLHDAIPGVHAPGSGWLVQGPRLVHRVTDEAREVIFSTLFPLDLLLLQQILYLRRARYG